MYYVITAPSKTELVEMVEQHLSEGWHLVGGVSVSQGPMAFSSTLYAQAVTKQQEGEKP